MQVSTALGLFFLLISALGFDSLAAYNMGPDQGKRAGEGSPTACDGIMPRRRLFSVQHSAPTAY